MTLKGNAGFRYTPDGGTEKEVRLQHPMSLEAAPGLARRRAAVDAWDFSSRTVWRSSSRRETFRAKLRFLANPREVLRFLDVASEVGADYYPDLSVSTSYPIEILDLEDVMQLDPDADRYGFGEYEYQIRVRSSDGTSLEPLYSPWLFKYAAGFSLSDATFSRSSDATYSDQDGTLQTASSGDIRDGHYVENESGVLVRSTRLEAARTNELHNSDSPATQTRNLTAGTYTLWMEGSGSVDASGATDGAYGTATEGQSNDLTFTVSAQQDVTFTVNNTVTRFQCEEGSFRSSFISTASSAVSRAADDLSFPISFGVQTLTVYQKFVDTGLSLSGDAVAALGTGHTANAGETNLLICEGWGEGRFRANIQNEAGNYSSRPEVDLGSSIGDVIESLTQVDVPAQDIGFKAAANGGSVQDGGTINTGALGSTWANNQVGIGDPTASTGGMGNATADLIALLIAPGVRTMEGMRSLAGVN